MRGGGAADGAAEGELPERCPVTGLRYARGPGAVAGFREPHALCICKADKVSSKGRRQRRVVIVTYQRLILCDEDGFIRRFQWMYSVSEVLWSEHAGAVHVLVRHTERDLLLVFAPAMSPCAQHEDVRAVALSLVDCIDTVRRCQQHLGPRGDVQARAAQEWGLFCQYGGARQVSTPTELRQLASLARATSPAPSPQRSWRAASASPPGGHQPPQCCALGGGLLAATPSPLAHSLPLSPPPPVSAPPQVPLPPSQQQQQQQEEDEWGEGQTSEPGAASGIPAAELSQTQAAGPGPEGAIGTTPPRSVADGEISVESPVLGRYTEAGGLLLDPSEGQSAAEGSAVPAGGSAQRGAAGQADAERRLRVLSDWCAELERNLIAARTAAALQEPPTVPLADPGVAVEGVDALRDELHSLRLSAQLHDALAELEQLREQCAALRGAVAQLRGERDAAALRCAEAEAERDSLRAGPAGELAAELVALRRRLSAALAPGAEGEAAGDEAAFAAGLREIGASEDEVAALWQLSVRRAAHLGDVSSRELRAAGLAPPLIRRLCRRFGWEEGGSEDQTLRRPELRRPEAALRSPPPGPPRAVDGEVWRRASG
eukprot:TRINITY_DN9340_c1_g1_i1.p1 TRINITY_DN9340_c1_g1~~TRINITY_DN9340_c1_g1_i1.p1  ORF type:complete len:602 (+),score=183.15 TRINITY_DN9340_c1_g1_i1:100-1905(+)